MHELLNLAAFFGLTCCFHCLGQHLETRFSKRIGPAHHAMLAGVIVHPTTLEALKEYPVHVVVYSGHVIPH